MNQKQQDNDCDRDGNHEHANVGQRNLQAFDRAQYSNRWRDHAIAIQQRGAEQAESDQEDARPSLLVRQQRHQGQDAALAAVVRAHHKNQVFDGDNQNQRPDDQREHAQDVGVGYLNGVGTKETLAQCV